MRIHSEARAGRESAGSVKTKLASKPNLHDFAFSQYARNFAFRRRSQDAESAADLGRFLYNTRHAEFEVTAHQNESNGLTTLYSRYFLHAARDGKLTLENGHARFVLFEIDRRRNQESANFVNHGFGEIEFFHSEIRSRQGFAGMDAPFRDPGRPHRRKTPVFGDGRGKEIRITRTLQLNAEDARTDFARGDHGGESIHCQSIFPYDTGIWVLDGQIIDCARGDIGRDRARREK